MRLKMYLIQKKTADMTPRELIRQTACRFQQAGIPDPHADSALLLSHLTGRMPLELTLDTDTHLSPEMLEAYENLVLARLTRKPLQYMMKEAFFYRRSFFVDERVLIPRPETELLCEWALELISSKQSPHVLDVCCGSGCIGLSIKAEKPDTKIILSDISADALDVSRINAKRLSLSAGFHQGDLLDDFQSSDFDMIVANPPYIPSDACNDLQEEVLMEPRLALDGGRDGMSFYRRLIAQAPACLKKGGILIMEIGYDQGLSVMQLLESSGYHSVALRKDYQGLDRITMGIYNP